MNCVQEAVAIVSKLEHGDEAHREWLRENATPLIADALAARDIEIEALKKPKPIESKHLCITQHDVIGGGYYFKVGPINTEVSFGIFNDIRHAELFFRAMQSEKTVEKAETAFAELVKVLKGYE